MFPCCPAMDLRPSACIPYHHSTDKFLRLCMIVHVGTWEGRRGKRAGLIERVSPSSLPSFPISPISPSPLSPFRLTLPNSGVQQTRPVRHQQRGSPRAHLRLAMARFDPTSLRQGRGGRQDDHAQDHARISARRDFFRPARRVGGGKRSLDRGSGGGEA